MRFSKLFIPTMREAPSDVTAVCQLLMLRAGYVRQLAAGLYIFLPLGWRVLNKVNRILKEEMEKIGAQEISMPVLHPAEIWQQTGRWYSIGEEMFRLKDRNNRDMCLGMTHEEIMTWVAAKEIKSYKELPQIWYQIQTKLRDEARPRGGVLRTREFIMKDSYSFDADVEGLDISYNLHAEAYHSIFKRCGLKYYQVDSDPGMMGGVGATAHEFMAPTPAGEDEIVLCPDCGYTANVEVAKSVASPIEDMKWVTEEVSTPEKRTINEVTRFLKIQPQYFIKTLILIAADGPVLALIRGDHDLHEKKLNRLIGDFRHASKDEIRSTLNVEAGFIGPMGHDNIRKIADVTLKGGNFIAGANKSGYHIKGIKPGVQFEVEWHDIQTAKADDNCFKCGGKLTSEKVIEIGNIFKLGTKYSTPLGAVFLDKNGQENPMIMGSYGIGPARIAAAAIEQSNDKDGIIWPRNISPFDLQIIPLNMNDSRTVAESEKLYSKMKEIYNHQTGEAMDVLIDDRDVRPGVKFKDADLIGIPIHVIIGEKTLKNDQIEIKVRRTGEIRKVMLTDAVREIIALYYEIR
ncbi:MAG: proline--tRNA ligase [Dissulfurispiraceae bacterium]|jgi:prolyl-tRNA synthetase